MKKEMKTILGCIRQADKDFGLFQEGDHILVGVSGGKDSLVLMHALGLYRFFSPKKFRITAATMDFGLKPIDTAAIAAACHVRDIPYVVKPSNVGQVLFETRKEKNPCALCAKMRRGILHDLAKELGCNKIALGHHREDALETFFLSLLYEGRINTFSPKVHMTRADLVQIRPLVYLPEAMLISAAKNLKLPVQESPCPMAGHTKRQEMKELMKHITGIQNRAPDLMLSALRNTEGYNLWDKHKAEDKSNPPIEPPVE